ncbi:hypothetical protein [Streptomyces sp. NPDC057909]|uniref:hypothetical protein n=1 Tax=Streptomyces sp. NPDC057909 TaxID=3346277 RepID=UPI0036E479E0
MLTARDDFTPQTLIKAAFDPYLTAFARLVPGLVAAWGQLPEHNRQKEKPADPISLLRDWDHRWADPESTATSVAVFWGEDLWALTSQAAAQAGMSVWDYMAGRATDAQRLGALETATQRLRRDFGSWKVPWGEINRYQRNDGAIVQEFSDASRASPCPSPRRDGAPPPRSEPRPTRERSAPTAPAATVSWRWWSSGRDSATARLGGDGRRGERASRLAALRRPGRTLRERRPAARPLLSR